MGQIKSIFKINSHAKSGMDYVSNWWNGGSAAGSWSAWAGSAAPRRQIVVVNSSDLPSWSAEEREPTRPRPPSLDCALASPPYKEFHVNHAINDKIVLWKGDITTLKIGRNICSILF